MTFTPQSVPSTGGPPEGLSTQEHILRAQGQAMLVSGGYYSECATAELVNAGPARQYQGYAGDYLDHSALPVALASRFLTEWQLPAGSASPLPLARQNVQARINALMLLGEQAALAGELVEDPEWMCLVNSPEEYAVLSAAFCKARNERLWSADLRGLLGGPDRQHLLGFFDETDPSIVESELTELLQDECSADFDPEFMAIDLPQEETIRLQLSTQAVLHWLCIDLFAHHAWTTLPTGTLGQLKFGLTGAVSWPRFKASLPRHLVFLALFAPQRRNTGLYSQGGS